MGKIGKDIHDTEDGDRIFVGPEVDRYPREDGGEVIVVEEPATDEPAEETGE